MSTISLIIESARPLADLTSKLVKDTTARKEFIAALRAYLSGVAGGAENAAIDLHTDADDPVAASATITLESCATDTVTIGGVTFTGASSPSGDEQFETDGSDAADAAALAAKINAHPTLSAVVVATVEQNVVTVTCRIKGVIGNFITLSETGTTITVSAAALEGGTGGPSGASTNYGFGL